MNESADRIALFVQQACLWEVTARKAGNVHRFVDFDDMSYLDFALSAAAIAGPLSRARQQSVGQTLLDCVRATQQVVRRNTNLGIILLLTPLARAEDCSAAAVEQVLADLSLQDAVLCYQAICLANPGGLGEATDQDVHQTPTLTLRQAMALAADRDLIARQYADGFREVFTGVMPDLLDGLKHIGCLEGAILWAQLRLLSRHPDTLIVRKRGIALARQASMHAREVLSAGWPETTVGWRQLAALDAWLRADGHARNPGTTADLIAAGLFGLLRGGQLEANAVWATPGWWKANDETSSLDAR